MSSSSFRANTWLIVEAYYNFSCRRFVLFCKYTCCWRFFRLVTRVTHPCRQREPIIVCCHLSRKVKQIQSAKTETRFSYLMRHLADEATDHIWRLIDDRTLQTAHENDISVFFVPLCSNLFDSVDAKPTRMKLTFWMVLRIDLIRHRNAKCEKTQTFETRPTSFNALQTALTVKEARRV